MKVGAIIPAAGRGTRIGAAMPKQFLQLRGKPLIHHTLKVFSHCEAIDYVVLVMPQIDVDKSGDDWLNGYEIVRKVVVGGQHRQDSVYNGFHALEESTEIVVVHDGVRPFATFNPGRDESETRIKDRNLIKILKSYDVKAPTVHRSRIDATKLFRGLNTLELYDACDRNIPPEEDVTGVTPVTPLQEGRV